MNVEFLDQFEKDLAVHTDEHLLNAVVEAIEATERVRSIREIPNVKKLKGHKDNYHIRVRN